MAKLSLYNSLFESMTGYNMRIMSFVISDIACLGREGALRIGGKTLNTTKLKVATRHRSDLLQS